MKFIKYQALVMIFALGSVLNFFSLSSLAYADNAVTAIKVTKLSVKGMTCAGCAANIQKKLKTIDGVEETKIDVKKGSAVVTYDDQKVKPEVLVKAINEIGYKASL